MSDYPQEFSELAQYLHIATSLSNGEAGAVALSYWARWTWAKKAGDMYNSGQCAGEAAKAYLGNQINLVCQIKQTSPVVADEKGKQLAANFVASERKRIMFMEQSGNWDAVLNEYQKLLQYLDIIIFAGYQVEGFKKIELGTKKRMKEIYTSLQSGTPVPANMSQSMAASNARAELAREPSMSSMPSISQQPSMPQPFQQPSMPSMPQPFQQPSMPSMPSISQQPSMPQPFQQSSMPSMPQPFQQSSMPSMPSMPQPFQQPQTSMPSMPQPFQQPQTSMPSMPSMPQPQPSMPSMPSMPQPSAQNPNLYEHHWDGQFEKMIGVYYEVANSMKQNNPKVAKATYEAMARECKKNPQYASYAQAYEAEANKL